MDPKEKKIPFSSSDFFLTLSKEEKAAILALDATKEFKKGDILIREGQIPRASFYVKKGLVRQFHLLEGEEITAQFYTNEESVFSLISSVNLVASKFTLECLEDSQVTVVSFEKEQEMYKKFPRFERMCRETTEKDFEAYQEKFARYISMTPEQRYRDVLKNRPDLIDRVPQYQLASYLGMKPESLSRIRRRIAGKGKV